MKKLYLLLLLISGALEAQINIPDPNLKARLLVYDTNDDGEIDAAEALAGTNINVTDANISDLTGIEAFTNLSELHCGSNPITTINLSNLPFLDLLDCSFSTQLTSIVLSDMPIFETLDCENSIELTSIDLSELHSTHFIDLDAHNCALNSLNLDGITGFQALDIFNNQLTVLDVSNCGNVSMSTALSGNPWQFLYLKNGTIEDWEIHDDFGTLQFICADESEIPYLLNNLTTNHPVVVNSYCSFVPGGMYNTISGNVRFDSNDNGCEDDTAFPYTKIKINDGLTQGASLINSNGDYAFYVGSGNFTLAPDIENPAWFNVAPSSAVVNFPTNANAVSVNDFCISPNGFHPDVEVVIAPYVPARPGFIAEYKLVYKNKGNATLEGNAIFVFEDALMDFISASVTPDDISSNTLVFGYENLKPFEQRSVILRFAIHSPGNTPPVNNGDVLHLSATITSVADENTADNVFEYDQTVVGSYDPNDKICVEGAVSHPQNIGKYLHYMINFENLGTADAENIVVRDSIDLAKFDLSTLQVMNSSHDVDLRIRNNIVEFIYKNINLPTAVSNPIGGHGNVLFKIRTLPTLHAGDAATNRANIYFDYNHPVQTNEARTTFSILKTEEFATDQSVSIYPNPVKNTVHIKANNSIKSLHLFDSLGRILQATTEHKNTASLDISDKPNGIYFIRITTENGSKVEKLVKE